MVVVEGVREGDENITHSWDSREALWMDRWPCEQWVFHRHSVPITAQDTTPLRPSSYMQASGDDIRLAAAGVNPSNVLLSPDWPTYPLSATHTKHWHIRTSSRNRPRHGSDISYETSLQRIKTCLFTCTPAVHDHHSQPILRHITQCTHQSGRHVSQRPITSGRRHDGGQPRTIVAAQREKYDSPRVATLVVPHRPQSRT